MSDLSRFVEEACAWLDGPETAPLSGKPETLSGGQNRQAIDEARSFRSFHSFRSENAHPDTSDLIGSETSILSAGGSRASGFNEKTPERPERPEREAKNPAGSASSLFPVEREEPERPERDGDACGRPFLDLNSAAPQKSDWWTGPAMAEADRLAPSAEPLPISSDEVRAGVERELRGLAEDGREGAAALRDAVEITRAKIRNSEALAERQAHPGRCHVCDGPLDDSAPVIAVLSGKRGAPLHLHAGCCDAYTARRAALVGRIMAAAGYSEGDKP